MFRRLVPALSSSILLAAGGYVPRPDLDAGRYLKTLADADAQLRSNPANALALAARSQALTALMRLPEALESARKAVSLQPALAEALLARSLAQAGTAVQQRNLGSLRGISNAMDDLRAAVKADPGLGAAWVALGLGYEQLPGILGGSTRKALACAESLKRVDAAKGAMLQGTILALEGNWTGAQGAFGSALAMAPRDPEIIYAFLDALGSRQTRKALGPEEQKRRLAQEGRRFTPAAQGSARALCAVCDAFIDAGLAEEAWGTAQAAMATVDAPSLLRLQLGKVAARTGTHQEQGLVYLKQVLAEPLEGGSGGHGTALWRRGQILKSLGRLAEAREAALAALALDPMDSKAKDLLDSLR